MEEDYKHPKMIHSSGFLIELDVYIEDLKLGVEYQGEQHYKSLYFWPGTDFETQRIRDEEKRRACKQVPAQSMQLSTYAVQHHIG